MKLRSIAEVSELLRRREVSPVELLRVCLASIEQWNPTLNSFITIMADSALNQAKLAEAEILAGNWRGPLHGVPLGLKDLIDTAGVRTTAASAVFEDRIPTEDAEVVKNLKAAGAVIIGKQNLHEFAYGGSSLISHFGAVRNPVNPEFIAGGSSGGSAAAVANGMCYAAIGTDTAGSIREPAAFCGVVGLKPTHGLVSTRGIIPLSFSLDNAGPITRTVEDAAAVLDAIAGLRPGASYQDSIRHGIRDFVIGVPGKFFLEDLHADISTAFDQAVKRFGRSVRDTRELDLPVIPNRTIFNAEAWAYHREMISSTPELYEPETLRRLRACEGVTEGEYEIALQELQSIRSKMGDLLQGADVLLTPTTPVLAPRIANMLKDLSLLRPVEVALLRNTRPVNVWGLPAISVPCHFTSAGMPIGLQIVGPPGGEANVLRAAYAFEQTK